jgi:hypothetical protein
MNAIATTNAELTVSQQGQVLVAASFSASGNLSANATKVITINSDVTANGTLAAAVTKVINIDSTLNANATLVSDALVSKTKNGSYVHAWVWVDSKTRRKRKKIEND